VKNKNIYPISDRLIAQTEKEKLLGSKGMVFWLYGLSGSGKSTMAVEMEKRLHEKGIHSVVLDGDNLRSGLNQDLSFSENDRRENIRRVSEVAKILSENGIIVFVSLITPLCQSK
jgi:adenylylsulfate kinase